jgi:methyltransferase (TIGR00027 family)
MYNFDRQPQIRGVADTALIGAAFRAKESARPDALLFDPLAGRLAGDLGFRLAHGHGLGWIVRTRLIDNMILYEICRGSGPAVCLGAGMDTRPYRLTLPSERRWVEIDFPVIMARKSRLLTNIEPACKLVRIGLDLSRAFARRRLLSRLGETGRAMVVTEGLLTYLTPAQVGSLARDLASAGFTTWILDLLTPDALFAQQSTVIGRSLTNADAPLRFAPVESGEFFRTRGWHVAARRSVLRAAVRFGRLSQQATHRLARQGFDAHVVMLRRGPS